MKKVTLTAIIISLVCSTASCGFAETELNVGTGTAAASDQSTAAPEPVQKDDNVHILIEDADLIISALGIEKTETDSGLRLKIENLGSNDITVTLGYDGVEYTSVNGYAIKKTHAVDVGAEETAEKTVSFTNAELSLYGIGEITEMELGFKVEDKQNNTVTYKAPVVYQTFNNDSSKFYVNGFHTAIGNDTVLEANGFDTDVAEAELSIPLGSNNIDVIGGHFLVGDNGHKTLMMELANTSGSPAYIDLDNWALNGVSVNDIDGSFDVCPAGKRVVLEYDIDTLFGDVPLDAIGIDELSTIDADFNISLDNDYDGKIDTSGKETSRISLHIDGTENIMDFDDPIFESPLFNVIAGGVVEIENSEKYSMGTAYIIENKTIFPIDIPSSGITLKINGVKTECSTNGCNIKAGQKGAILVAFNGEALGADEKDEISIGFSFNDDAGKVLEFKDIVISY